MERAPAPIYRLAEDHLRRKFLPAVKFRIGGSHESRHHRACSFWGSAIGFAGSLLVRPESRPALARTLPGGRGPAQGKVSKISEKPEEHAPARSKLRSDRSKTAPADDPRVSVPLHSVAQILKEKQFAYSDFEGLDRQMADALTLLGVSAQDKAAITSYMKTMYAEVLSEEKKHVKVSKADAGRVTLDLSGMAGPSERIAARTKEAFRESLPSDAAETLIASIDWDKFYFRGEASEVSFRVTRNVNGSLMATTATGWGTHGSGLNSKEYPDDGTPIPAAKIFEPRWQQHLGEMKLPPVNE